MRFAEDFTPQMQRLRAQWPNFYSDERVKVIWSWVSPLPAATWERMVTFQLGNHADTYRGPLQEIFQAAQREKEALWERAKAREHEDAAKFFQSTPMPDEVRERLARLGLYKIPPAPSGAGSQEE